jgi:hypothetical protein
VLDHGGDRAVPGYLGRRNGTRLYSKRGGGVTRRRMRMTRNGGREKCESGGVLVLIGRNGD